MDVRRREQRRVDRHGPLSAATQRPESALRDPWARLIPITPRDPPSMSLRRASPPYCGPPPIDIAARAAPNRVLCRAAAGGVGIRREPDGCTRARDAAYRGHWPASCIPEGFA